MSAHRHSLFAALALAVVGLWGSVAPAAESAPAGPSGAKPDRGLRRYIYSLHPDGSQEGYNCKGPASGLKGIAVLDIGRGCTFVRCIPLPCLDGMTGGHGGRGIVGHTGTQRIFYTFMLSNERTGKGNHGVVGCLDVETDRVLWETYLDEIPEAEGHSLGAGNPAVTPDGKKLYVPPEWTGGKETTVLDASDGKWIAFVPTGGCGCGNAIMAPDGKVVYASRDAVKIDTATDRIVRTPSSGSSGARPFQGLADSHYLIDPTGRKLYGTCELPTGCAAIVFDTATEEVLARLEFPATGPFAYFRQTRLCWHEGSFTPDGKRFWIQSMEDRNPGPREDLRALVADEVGGGIVKWVSEWDVSRTPPILVRAIGSRSPGHSHAHALVTREGDLLLTGNGHALDTTTGKVRHTWKDKDGKWFQGTKIMQVNFRDGQVDWVGQRHGTGWLYQAPPVSEASREVARPGADTSPPGAAGKPAATIGAPKACWPDGEVLFPVDLKWSPAGDDKGLYGYAVYGNGTLFRHATEPRISCHCLEPGQTYRFEIEPVDLALNRGPRSAVSVTTPALTDAQKDALVRVWLNRLLTEARAARSRSGRLGALKAIRDRIAGLEGDSACSLEWRTLAAAIGRSEGDTEAGDYEEVAACACSRTADQAACVDALAAALPEATPTGTCALLRLLGRLGGEKARAAVRQVLADVPPAPPNLARNATAAASSELKRATAARFAVDGRVPDKDSQADDGAAWAASGRTDPPVSFTLRWDQPVRIAQVVYYGRTAWDSGECWRDCEVYLDDASAPAAKAQFAAAHGPQGVRLARAATARRLTLKFLTSHGGANPGASEIKVFAEPVADLDAAEVRATAEAVLAQMKERPR